MTSLPPATTATELVNSTANASSLDPASLTFDFVSWTTDQLKSAADNVAQYAPSPRDLVLAGPRAFMKLGSFAFETVPDAVDSALGIRIGQRVIPEATIVGGTVSVAEPATAPTIVAAMAQRGADVLGMDDPVDGFASRFSMESLRSFGNIFNYATSKWAMCCIVMAIVLNRTHVYASTRRNLTLSWKLRLGLRILPIILFAVQAQNILRSIQCQTSPDFSVLRWNNASKSSDLLFTYNGGFLHTLSSNLLLGASDADSCRAVNMVPPENYELLEEPVELAGSLGRLWPLFETFCLSHFVETVSCAVQGRPVAAETGMTLFEHSLAFAEADAAISSQLGWSPYSEKEKPATSRSTHVQSSSDGGAATTTAEAAPKKQASADVIVKRSMIMKKVNTSPEVLLVGFLSSMNHITSHVLGIFNLQSRLRLINTAFWGLCFMSMITYSLATFSVEDITSHSLLRFPTVCIIGFIPHVLVLTGILLCGFIYTIALILSALAGPPPDDNLQRGFLSRLLYAHENLQANLQLPNLRINMQMDFYTALLKTGFSVLTMASEAVYLNESREVTVKPMTWLEEDRLREIEENGVQWLGPTFRAGDDGDGMAAGVGLSLKASKQQADSLPHPNNGFAKERVAQSTSKSAKQPDRVIRDGVGATERSGRWIMAFEFFVGIAKLGGSWLAAGMIKALTTLGIRWRPRWLLVLAQYCKPRVLRDPRQRLEVEPLSFWLVGPDGELRLPQDAHVDVEIEMRNRLKNENRNWTEADETRLDSKLYKWFVGGGWWGEDDSSGAFVPHQDSIDDDLTSVISATDSELEWESDDDDFDDGQRTPTQRSPNPSRESTPMTDLPLNVSDLSQLLHPRTPEQRAEAHALAAHLSSNRIMTRSQYRSFDQRERARVLTSTPYRPPHLRTRQSPLSAEEEAEVLEHIIKTRREQQASTGAIASASGSWADGAAGLGDGGPQCVVCHSSPRSIILWPCRCLSMCDDCRVTLAMQNFDKCPCCRRDVNSFSRIYVP